MTDADAWLVERVAAARVGRAGVTDEAAKLMEALLGGALQKPMTAPQLARAARDLLDGATSARPDTGESP